MRIHFLADSYFVDTMQPWTNGEQHISSQNSENQEKNHFIVTKLLCVCNICHDWIMHANIKNRRGICQNVTIYSQCSTLIETNQGFGMSSEQSELITLQVNPLVSIELEHWLHVGETPAVVI